ncbi:uncharacterized protein FIBRA_09091 [Fibroporia radiculosa]|uniref:Uncharacterized protein n=1 Tax=Fibroporia radiculosa TaxID=599839 RepID=J4ICP9_9APHY|nr:uncharacterized protein FIBRA_09091 [Fibroporia radiculosa]CCM06791.1 predicted protein [Fibroporia radiculosa]
MSSLSTAAAQSHSSRLRSISLTGTLNSSRGPAIEPGRDADQRAPEDGNRSGGRGAQKAKKRWVTTWYAMNICIALGAITTGVASGRHRSARPSQRALDALGVIPRSRTGQRQAPCTAAGWRVRVIVLCTHTGTAF